MIERAQTRHQQEKQAKEERQDNFEETKQQMVQDMQLFTFDKSQLPPVNLPQIPYKMRANAHQESCRVIMETRVIQNLI
jgi:hypothetical protein